MTQFKGHTVLRNQFSLKDFLIQPIFIDFVAAFGLGKTSLTCLTFDRFSGKKF